MKKIRIIHRSRNYSSRLCPTCGRASLRKGLNSRKIKDISLDGPLLYEITYSKHYCKKCNKHFSCPMDDLAPKGSHFSQRTRQLVLSRLQDDMMNIKIVQKQMSRDFHVTIPCQTIYRWVNEKILSKS